MNRIINYVRDTQAEMKHVSWPTRKQATAFTVAVILIAVIVSLVLGLFDTIFTSILDRVLL